MIFNERLGVADDTWTGEEDASTILIVDDFDLARRTLAAMLKSESREVLQASSGAEALELLSKKIVDLVVLDKGMPVMDGLECCRRIKAAAQFVPVLILTGSTSPEDELAAVRSGADQFLGKPVHPDVLRARTRSLIAHGNLIRRLEETEAAFLALAQAVEKRDRSMAGHCERLASLSVAFGKCWGSQEGPAGAAPRQLSARRGENRHPGLHSLQ